MKCKIAICTLTMRLENLMNAPEEKRMVKDESTDDAVGDLATYLFLFLINKKRQKQNGSSTESQGIHRTAGSDT